MINELDKELGRRGHRFVRYVDNVLIFCKSRKSVERTLENIITYIEEELFLKVEPGQNSSVACKQDKISGIYILPK